MNSSVAGQPPSVGNYSHQTQFASSTLPHQRTWNSAPIYVTLITLLAMLEGCASSTTGGIAANEKLSSIALPYSVSFVGVQDVFGRNALGDAIVITAVHGTAETVQIGNTYQIDGAYTLESHDQATLSAYLTATQSNEPHRKAVPGQSLTIQKGSGTFSVFLRVEDPGCPHVSFYPVDGGESFAGEYFGTGDSVPPDSWRVRSQMALR